MFYLENRVSNVTSLSPELLSSPEPKDPAFEESECVLGRGGLGGDIVGFS